MNPRIFSSVMILSAIALLFSMFPSDNAEAVSLCAEISPAIIRQGDAFTIKVTQTKGSAVPVAKVARNAVQFSRCGEGCFIGIGAVSLDAKTGPYPVKVKAGNKRQNLRLVVRKAVVRTITMTLPDEKVLLSTADLKIVKEENNRLKTLFLTISERLWDGVFRIPTENEILTYFGTRRIMNKTWTSIHRGVDIRGSEGEEVRASNNGRVVLAEKLFFGGNTIILDHGQGIHTIYMHLSQINVHTGNLVSKGDVIGLVGATGRSTGPHLHFGIKISNVSVDPLSVLNLKL